MTTLGDRYSTFPNLCFVGSRTGKKCALKVIRDCPESRREVGLACHQKTVKVSGVCTIVFLFRWSFSGRPAAARRYSLKSWLSNPPPPLSCQSDFPNLSKHPLSPLSPQDFPICSGRLTAGRLSEDRVHVAQHDQVFHNFLLQLLVVLTSYLCCC